MRAFRHPAASILNSRYSEKPDRFPGDDIGAGCFLACLAGPWAEAPWWQIRSSRDGHIANMTMLQLPNRLWRDDLTVHGFRSTFQDWTAVIKMG